jgi:DNA invertase Pin-like site-specific DNA recombinase
MLIGYARVSTADQKLDLQNDALTKAGCERIFTDTASGANAARTGLEQALAFVRQGDTIVVWKLDRLGRSLRHLVETLADLRGRGVGFRSLQESIDTTTSGGNLAGSSAIREGLSEPGPGPLVGTFRPPSPRLRVLPQMTHYLRNNEPPIG